MQYSELSCRSVKRQLGCCWAVPQGAWLSDGTYRAR